MSSTRTTPAVVTATMMVAALSACGSGSGNSATSSTPSSPSTVTSAPSSSSTTTSASPSSTTSSSSTTAQASSSTSPAPVTSASKPEQTSAKPAGALNTAIRHHSFANATFMTEVAGTVTLHDGMSTASDPMTGYNAGLPGTANGLGTGKQPVAAYGDVNGDGIEDAVVELDLTQGNGVSVEFSVWEGTASGGAKQLGKPFLTHGRCGIVAKTFTIGADGIITVTGNGRVDSCASAGTGAPFTATYRVTNGAVVAIKAAPDF